MIITTILAITTVALAGLVAWQRRDPLVHRRVVVSIDGERGGVEGVLVRSDPRYLRLEQAVWLNPDGTTDPVAGRAFVPRARVTLIQELPAARPPAPPTA